MYKLDHIFNHHTKRWVGSDRNLSKYTIWFFLQMFSCQWDLEMWSRLMKVTNRLSSTGTVPFSTVYDIKSVTTCLASFQVLDGILPVFNSVFGLEDSADYLAQRWINKQAVAKLTELYRCCQQCWCACDRQHITSKDTKWKRFMGKVIHSPMLHPPSGTGCQTSFTEKKTLLFFSSSWSHICFQLCDLLIPLP